MFFQSVVLGSLTTSVLNSSVGTGVVAFHTEKILPVGFCVTSELEIASAAVPTQINVFGVVTASTNRGSTITVQGYWENETISAMDGKIMYLADDGSIQNTPGSFEKIVGQKIEKGIFISIGIGGGPLNSYLDDSDISGILLAQLDGEIANQILVATPETNTIYRAEIL